MPRLVQILSAFAALSAVVAAQPHHRHQALHQGHNKRDLVIETLTETVYTTIDEIFTVYDYGDETTTVTPTPVAPSTTSTSTSTSTSSSSSIPTTTSTVTSTFSAVSVAPQFYTTATSTTPSTASTSSTPIPEPAVATSAATTQAPVVPTTFATSSSVYIPSSSSSSSTAAAAAAATPSDSPVSASESGLQGSSTATCDSTSQACTGDITYYEAGLGACGITNDGSTEDVLALPHDFMGTQSNGNPYCGKTVKIYNPNNGKTATGTVVDKCMGCVDRAIDLSNHLFDQLADESAGRVSGIVWYFTS